MSSVACSAGFASCKTFGKQPKHPCFGRSTKRGEGGSPTLSPGMDAGRVCPKALHDAEPTKHTQPFTTGKGVFGKDAEIRTHQALHEAKPIECPKGDRDNKSEVYFKNRLFLQAEPPFLRTAVICI